jgi:hypothetical protein
MNIFSYLRENSVGFEPTEEYNIEPTTESSDAAVIEFAQDIAKITSALYVADALIEATAVVEGSSFDPAPVLEATVGDAINKIKAKIKELWGKLKAWFKTIVENIKVLFMNGETFVKKYKDELLKKNAKDYKYKGYGYDIVALDSAVDSIRKAANNEASKISGLASITPESIKTADDMLTEYESKLGKVITADSSEDVVSALGKAGKIDADNTSELRKKLFAVAHKGEVVKGEIRGFSENSVADMIKFISGYSEIISKINKDKASTDQTFSDLIKSYERIGKVIEGKADEVTSVSKITSVTTSATTNVRTCLAVSQAAATTRVDVYKEAYHTFVAALKGVFRARVKESYGYSDDSHSGSILEQALGIVG